MISDLSSLYFPPYFKHTDFTVIIVDDGELIFSSRTISDTICKCTVNYPIVSLEIQI